MTENQIEVVMQACYAICSIRNALLETAKVLKQKSIEAEDEQAIDIFSTLADNL